MSYIPPSTNSPLPLIILSIIDLHDSFNMRTTFTAILTADNNYYL